MTRINFREFVSGVTPGTVSTLLVAALFGAARAQEARP
jgi:hypothetical protein